MNDQHAPHDVAYLDLEDLMAAAEAALETQVEVRDYGLLDSAIARPQASVFGEDAYPTILTKAAALVESLVTNHALVDGNKRLAYVALRYFLLINGYDFTATEDERFDFIIAIADGSLRGVEDIAKALSGLVERTD